MGYTIDSNPENLKAIIYDMIVVTKNGNYGVLDFNLEEIIGTKYKTMEFNEYTQDFIVSNEDGKYGIFAKDATTEVELQYDSIELINNSPLIYKVKKENKFAVMKEDFSLITNIEYDEMGYPKDISKDIKYTLVIPKLNEKFVETIVVRRDSKYGLIEMETGKTFIPCEMDAIYCRTSDKDNKDYYIIQKDNKLMLLTEYVEKIKM